MPTRNANNASGGDLQAPFDNDPLSMWRRMRRPDLPKTTQDDLRAVLRKVCHPSRHWAGAVNGNPAFAIGLVMSELQAPAPRPRLLDLAASSLLCCALDGAITAQVVLVHAIFRTLGRDLDALQLALSWNALVLLQGAFRTDRGHVCPRAMRRSLPRRQRPRPVLHLVSDRKIECGEPDGRQS